MPTTRADRSLQPGVTEILLVGLTCVASFSLEVAAEWKSELGLQTLAFDNLFVDQSKQQDAALRPSWGLSMDFGDYWATGYKGEFNHYFETTTLQSHFHEVFLYANPVWGEEGQNEFVAELTVETLRNQDTFQILNYFQPALYLKTRLEPASWFAWQIGGKVLYRQYYDDQGDSSPDSVDGWLDAYGMFTLPSRTTISPKVAYGHRFYTHEQTAGNAADSQDQSLELGLHLSQGLWGSAGLQADYAYTLAIGDSGVLQRKLTEEQFAYIGQEFLFSGHRATLGFKQLIGEGGRLNIYVTYETKDYAGWPLLDETGAATGAQREDTRLIPGVSYQHEFYPSEGSLWPVIGLIAEYRFIDQQSNLAWSEAQSHMGGLTLWVRW